MPKKPSKPSTRYASSVETELKQDAHAILRAALLAADPYQATLAKLKTPPASVKNIYVIGAGKASATMARAAEEALGERIHSGVIVTKYGHGEKLTRIECLEASHPIPDEAGVDAARRIAQLCLNAGKDDLIVCLISGGASALLPFPTQPIRLGEKQATTKLMLACGATIGELNCVRKHLSSIKGGQLAHLAYPARVETLILSDVIGDPLDVIGSGPTVPDPSTFGEAWSILQHHRLLSKIPPSVKHHLEQGVNGQIPETPKEGDEVFRRVGNHLIGSNRLSLHAAQAEAKSLGYRTLLLSTSLDGEAKEAAKSYAAIAREVHASGNPVKAPVAILSGGETTVTLSPHPGLGGRNQEMALAVAIGIEGLPRTLFCAAGTDGTDGPTDAAGAFACGSTLAKAAEFELKALEFLGRNDSYHFFKPLDLLLTTGPTGTNVMDIHLLLIK